MHSACATNCRRSDFTLTALGIFLAPFRILRARASIFVGMPDEAFFATLIDYLSKVPAITGKIGSGFSNDGCWWVKFAIDIKHPLAWSVVQELGHVLNYLSLEERLPAVFMPVSPPPYLNGGPEYLSWVIECGDKNFRYCPKMR
jgi:hypothetical protein